MLCMRQRGFQMQINFTPHKIKSAKAYISNLFEDEKKLEKMKKKREKNYFFSED